MADGRVLVLDDDRAIRETITACLELEDYAVAGASGLADGITLLTAEPFDLVIADLFASRFSPGALAPVAALEHVRPGTPIVLATGFAEAATLDPREYGLTGILIKPFDLDELLAMVQGALTERSSDERGLRSTPYAAWRAPKGCTYSPSTASWESLIFEGRS